MKQPMYLIFLGPPGVGKGTQAACLKERWGIEKVSSGDLFREHFHNNTELGRIAKSYMDEGELVPDEITTQMVMHHLDSPSCENGAIFDGFPRTVAQAQSLDELLLTRNTKIDVVIWLNVPEEVIVDRLSGRRISEHGRVYHIKYNPPMVEGICDVDGSNLYQREDDKPETIKHRLEVYNEKTAPLINFYREKGVLAQVDGVPSIDEVTSLIRNVIS